MRAVFDTNVIVSGRLWRGVTYSLFDFVESGHVTLCLTPKILTELERVLEYPHIQKHLLAAEFTIFEMLEYLREYSIVVEDIDRVRVVKEDPSDDVIVNAALSAEAKWIVSGDRRLLDLKSIGDIRIVTPTQFLKEVL